jgi:ribosome recycling factor
VSGASSCRRRPPVTPKAQIKASEKKHAISEDDMNRWSEEVQKLTDGNIKRIDDLLVEKEREIKQV